MPDDLQPTLPDVDPRPGPAARTARGAGQLSVAALAVDAMHAWDAFGSDTWTAEQAGERWPIIALAAGMVVSALHNLANYVRSKRFAEELRQLRDALDGADPGRGRLLVEAPPASTAAGDLAGRSAEVLAATRRAGPLVAAGHEPPAETPR